MMRGRGWGWSVWGLEGYWAGGRMRGRGWGWSVWEFGGWRVIGLEGGCVEEVRREWS